MKKILALFLSLVTYEIIYSQDYPDISTFIVDTLAGSTKFDYSCNVVTSLFNNCKSRRKHVRLETPPWILGVRDKTRYYYTTDGSSSYVTAIDQDIIQYTTLDLSRGTGPTKISENAGCLEPLAVPANLFLREPLQSGFYKATQSIKLADGIKPDTTRCKLAIVNGLLAGQDWRRSYYNVYTAQNLTHPAEGALTIGFLDAENKATCTGKNIICPSTVTPIKPYYPQPYGCPLKGDYWPTMAGFICASWVRNNSATNYGQHYFDHDMGPITWPGNGYVSRAGNRTGHGVGLPSSITYDGYVYVFYHDDGPMQLPNEPPVPPEEGRQEGIKVIRAPVSDCLDPHAWRAYYKDPNGTVHWSPSLPAGFDKNNMDVFWAEKGPLSTDVMNDMDNQYEQKRFSVARAVNSSTPLFIGVEESVNNKTDLWEISLRLSNDLLNWSSRKLVIYAGTWADIHLNYPIFCDAEGWSNTAIDLNDFYVLGKGAEDQFTNSFNKYHIYNPAVKKGTQ
jgi:hypothetical protein